LNYDWIKERHLQFSNFLGFGYVPIVTIICTLRHHIQHISRPFRSDSK
jgi:hypothetical protein